MEGKCPESGQKLMPGYQKASPMCGAGPGAGRASQNHSPREAELRESPCETKLHVVPHGRSSADESIPRRTWARVCS